MEENMRRDPYEVLGVSRNASRAEIRKAYHKLALRHHPDKCNGDAEAKAAATKKFAEIGAAYETLTNPEAAAAASGGGGRGDGPMYDDYGGAAGGVPFGHPFFQSRPGPFPSAFPASSVFGSMFHETDPFMTGMGGASPFFHFTDPFELFERTFGKTAFDVDDDDGGIFGIPTSMPPGGGGFATVSFSSSSMVPDPSTGSMKTISTSTQVVNGRRTTKTETTVIHPDGRRETFVEIDGGDGAGPSTAPPRLSQRAHGETLLPAVDGTFERPPVAPRRADVGTRAATPPRAESSSHKRSHDEMASAQRQPESPPRAARPQAELQRRDGRLGTPEDGVGQGAACPRVFVGESDEHDVIDLTKDGGGVDALPMSPIVSPTDQEVSHDDDGAGGEGSTTEGPRRKRPRHEYEEGLLPDFNGHAVNGWPTQQNHNNLRNGDLAGVMPRAGIGDENGPNASFSRMNGNLAAGVKSSGIGDENGRNTLFLAGGMQRTQDRCVEGGDAAESSPRAVFDQGNGEMKVSLEGCVQHPPGITDLGHTAGGRSMPMAVMNGVEPLSKTALPPGGQSANVASQEESYYSLTVPFLKEKLRERGLTVSGRKAELIERLLKSEGKQS